MRNDPRGEEMGISIPHPPALNNPLFMVDNSAQYGVVGRPKWMIIWTPATSKQVPSYLLLLFFNQSSTLTTGSVVASCCHSTSI